MAKPHQGRFIPENHKKYVGDVNNIIYRSGYEKKAFLWADRNPRVLQWGSEEIVVPYFHRSDQKMRRYFTDMVVKYRKRDDTIITYLIEIKPYTQTIPPKPPRKKTTKTKHRFLRETLTYEQNQDKWEAARAYAKKHGMEFIIMTETELGIRR